jgi:hypothetical protein
LTVGKRPFATLMPFRRRTGNDDDDAPTVLNDDDVHALSTAVGRVAAAHDPDGDRDVRGSRSHPMTPEATLTLAGRQALGARDTA